MRIPKEMGIIALFMLLVGLFVPPVFGQEKVKFQIDGSITEVVSNEKIPYAVIQLPALNVWAVTDDNGAFTINDVPGGEWVIEVSCLGYQKIEKSVLLKQDILKMHLQMHPQDLTLKDVLVTAEAGTNINSSSRIGRTAIQHLQAASIKDVLQLLPGQITANPDLSKPGALTIRETDTGNDANALGTSLVVDGARISNDANLQRISTSKDDTRFPVLGGGAIDVRKISADRIESVEVIRGVASAEYGDLTSGAVIMRTKAGITPYEISLKTDPRLKSAALGKGVSLGGRKGFLNVDADYTHALKDIRTVSDSYNRISGQVGYSNSFSVGSTRLNLNTKASGYLTLNTTKNDPDKKLSEYVKNTDNEMNLNVFGNWLFNKAWITSLRYTFFGSYGYQRMEGNREYEGAIPIPVTYTTESGEQLAMMMPSNYTQLRIVEGKPVYFQGKISANVVHNNGSFFNRLMVGSEWSSVGNKGNGKWGECMPLGYRNRSFSEIPFIHNYSFFGEDKINYSWGISSFELQAGLRMTNIITDAADYHLTLDPRFNGRFNIIDRPASEGLKLFAVRAGWGIQHKMPTLTHLYPDPFYSDILSYSYQSADFSESLVLMTTQAVNNTANPDLKLPQSRNYEIGMDLNIGSIKGSVCYFNEILKNAFMFDSYLSALPYRVYDRTATMPEYVDGMLVCDGQPVPFTNDTVFSSYTRPGNKARVEKWGIEYTLNLGKIPSINTSIILDGAYMNIRRLTVGESYIYKSGTFNQQNRKYAAVYACNPNSGIVGYKSERLNTNVRFVTNIPKIRMVVSLGVQCVWRDRAQRLASDSPEARVIMRDENGNKVEGNVYKDDKYLKYVYPTELIDFSGNRIPFDEAMLDDAQVKDYELRMNPSIFMADDPKPYFLLNLRITKEFRNIARFSFYVNNLTHSNPYRYFRSIGLNKRVNSDIYCGAELTLSF